MCLGLILAEAAKNITVNDVVSEFGWLFVLVGAILIPLSIAVCRWALKVHTHMHNVNIILDYDDSKPAHNAILTLNAKITNTQTDLTAKIDSISETNCEELTEEVSAIEEQLAALDVAKYKKIESRVNALEESIKHNNDVTNNVLINTHADYKNIQDNIISLTEVIKDKLTNNVIQAQPQKIDNNTVLNRKILIVEDSAINAMTAVKLVKRLGFEPLSASTGAEALDLLHLITPRVDCILIDLSLPDMDGFELNKRIKLDSTTRHIPIIAVSASSLLSDRERCKAAGINIFINKPLDLLSLENAFKELKLCC